MTRESRADEARAAGEEDGPEVSHERSIGRFPKEGNG
jgi:hypothetical protein